MCKQIEIKISLQGEPVVNEGWVKAEGENVIALEIDMETKYCEVDSLVFGGVPGIIIAANSDESLKNPTWIEFPEYPEYRIWSAQIFRYTLCVCLIKDTDSDEII